MPTPAQLIEAEAMKLPPEERAELAERLFASVEPAMPLHPAWEPEIARRVADLRAGRSQAVPGEQVFGELRSMLDARGDAAQIPANKPPRGA